MKDVLYYGGIENTRFGKVLFDGDFKLKQYALGYDVNDQEIVSSVPGYKSLLKRYLDKNPAPNQLNHGRQWITPKDVILKRDDTTNSFVFDTVTMELNYEPMQVNDPLYDQASEEFAQHHTQNFDSFANEIPEYKDIKQLGKIVSVIKWLADNSIATDFQWASDYAPKIVQTPTQVQELEVNNITYNGYNIISISGGVEYLTDNSYQAANGSASTIKTASEAVNAPKEEINWNFTSGGQNYEAVAVAAEAFRSLGSYGTSVTDMGFDTCGDVDLSFTRSYSSFSGGQNSIGRGWSFLPAQLTDNKPASSGRVVSYCSGSTPPGESEYYHRAYLAFQGAGQRETFAYDDVTCQYLPDDNSYHSKITTTRVNSNKTLYTIKTKEQKKYVFEELWGIDGKYTDYAFRLVSVEDKTGTKVNYAYDSQSRLASLADDRSHSIAVSYNSNNLISKITDWNNREVNYTYDTQGNLLTASDPRGNVTTYTYDANNKLTSIKDRENNTILTNTYTPEAKIETQTKASNVTDTYTYNEANKKVTKSDTVRTEETTYDYKARILTQKDPLNNITTYTYGAELSPLTVTDKNGKTTTNIYDLRGNLITVTDPNSKTVTYEYDTEDRLTKNIDARYSPAKVTENTYDSSGNLAEVDEDGKVTTSTYDQWGEMLTKNDPEDRTTTWTRDAFGNPLTEKDEYNNTTSYEYHNLGWLQKATDPENREVSYTYDNNGNKVTETNALGVTSFEYNKENNVKKIITPNTATTQFTYNPSQALASVIDPLNHTTAYTRDGHQNMSAKQDALNRTTEYMYDKLNRRTELMTPLGKVSNWEYDPNGNITKRIDANNEDTLYEYDNLNRLKKIMYPNTSTVNYTYDDRGNVLTTVDPTGTSTYAYDKFDRLTQVTDSNNNVVAYEYDDADNLTKITYPGNKIVNYAYDNANRLTTVTDWNNKQIVYDYYKNGLLKTKTNPNGVVSAYTYDNANKLAQLHHTKNGATLAKYDYQRNSIGNITKVIETGTTPTPTPTPGNSGSPYGGTPRAVPGTIQVEDFNTGGEGVAYHDVDSSNNGGAYRTSEGVDVSQFSSGQYDLGWTKEGEWMNYTINATTSGTYTFNARVGSPWDNSKFHAEIDGVDVTGPIEVDNTGGWNNWATLSKSGINISAGTHVLKIMMDQHSTQDQWIANMDWVSFTLTSTPTPTPTGAPTPTPTPGNDGNPYGGTARAVPGTVQAEDFNNGGENVAYHDLDAANNGNTYRTSEGVDISEQSSNQFNVGWTREGEWLKYTINASNSGQYTFNARVGSPWDNSMFHAEIDGVDVTGPIEIDSTGGWNNWATLSKSGITLTAGTHILKIVMDQHSTQDQWIADFDWFSFVSEGIPNPTPTPTAAATPTPTVTPTSTPTPTPLQVDLNDKTGKGHTLTNNGATEVSTNLPFVESTLALDFESSESDYLTTPDTTDLSVINTHKFTVEFWAKVESLSDNNTVISKNTPGQYEYKLTVGKANGSIEYNVFRLDGNNRYTGTSVASIITPGTWNHIAMVVDDAASYTVTNARIYVNGTEISYNSHLGGEPHYVANGTAPLEIGRYSPGSNYYDGMLDEVRVWNTARTASEITQGMDNELNGTETGLVAYYQLDPIGNDDAIYYTYDVLSRLKKSSKPSYVNEYMYDNVGNMLTSKLNGTQSSYTYNTDNQLTQKNSTTFTYDNRGNQTDSGDKDLTYDADNKLKTVTDPNDPDKEYIYDGNGDRIEEKTNGTASMEYVNDVSGELTNVLIAKNLSTSTDSYYLYGAGLIGRGGVSEQNREYYLEDGTGNIRYLTDSSGNVIETYAYDPYGNLLAGNTPTDFAYKGEQIDSTTGLYFMRARYYNPATGSFISRDPSEGQLKNVRSQNGYNFADADSINLSDPLGLWTVDLGLSVGTGWAGITTGVQISDTGLYSYGGVGVAQPGPGVSLTYSNSNPTAGLSTSAGGGFIVGGSGNIEAGTGNTSAQIGLTTPGYGAYAVQTYQVCN